VYLTQLQARLQLANADDASGTSCRGPYIYWFWFSNIYWFWFGASRKQIAKFKT